MLLENLLRREDGGTVRKEDIQALIDWDPKAKPSAEIAFMPARVLLQDFTGVPAVVDLAAMRDATAENGVDAARINPQVPVDLVIDHSVQVDQYGTPDALAANVRARVRAQPRALRVPALGRGRLRELPRRAARQRHRPPDQPRVPRLGRLPDPEKDGETLAYPDTLVGTDSHTTMINGLGVLGWGVGGIEAEAAMLGQPISMLIPQVVGFRLTGALPAGTTATDLVLTVTEQLRQVGVVGKFVEFFGPGPRRSLARRPRDDRQHGARVRRHDGLLPDRREDARVPALLRPRATSRSRSSRRTRRRRACSARRRARAAFSDRARARPGDRRAEPGRARSGRRTASRSPAPSASFQAVRDEIVGPSDGGGTATATPSRRASAR